ncbi:family 20 glycosylhydrolase [Planobispora takensis]|uniref:beta-N-acetylhexosaminidase n=1 Tax=Planobispora takensis TaxID=1367882 RepID=A0A8J3T4Z6_9ACTN|nr:family 20 glycosylhydrolase [Planobispora takensis]GII05286.1 beta-hexosaminidase [Planobispora takensis]
MTSETRCATSRTWRIGTAEPALEETAETLRELLSPHLAALAAGAQDRSPGTLRLVLGQVGRRPDALGVPPRGDGHADECHELVITPDGIVCRARTPQGVFRGAVAAVRLLSAAPGGDLACRRTEDGPRYAWRGLMVDPARCFLPLDELLRLVDLAALYHLNVLHLHLTDNEGWRLEIAGRPGLTAAEDGSFYSAAQYRELQAYAAARFVTIVPEIDLPGHTAAVLRAHPELGTVPRPAWLPADAPFSPPLDPCDPGTRAFLAEVLTEVARLTDGPYLHIGGDEAFGIDEASFAEAIRFARETVRVAGKRPLGWQESARAGIGPGDIAQWWVDVPMMDLPADEAELAARPELAGTGRPLAFFTAVARFFAPADGDLARIVDGGGRVLLSPQSHLYLDRPYDASIVPPGQAEAAARLGFSYRPRDVRHAAAWDPAAYGLAPDRIAGIEATLFGESLRGLDDLTTLLLPRLAGIAETAWTGSPPAWEAHRESLAGQSRLWRERGITALLSTEIDWR